MDAALLAAMAKHRDLEEMAARIYQQLSAWCEWQGWVGSAAYFCKEAKEEQQHAQEWQDYILDRGGVVSLGAQAAFTGQSASDSLLSKFESALSAEDTLLEAINVLCQQAESDQDAERFMQAYTKAGVEQIRDLTVYCQRLKRAGVDQCALQLFDEWIGNK